MLEKFREKIKEAKRKKEYNYTMFKRDYLPNVLYATMMNQISEMATLQPEVEEAVKKYLKGE